MLHINIVGVVTCSDNSTHRLVTCSLSLDLFLIIHFIITLHSTIAATSASQYKKTNIEQNAINSCHVLQFHVLQFHALQFWWSVIFMSVIFSALPSKNLLENIPAKAERFLVWISCKENRETQAVYKVKGKRATLQCALWWQRYFCQWIDFESGRHTKESEKPHVKFHETGIHHSSVGLGYTVSFVRIWSCLRKRRAQKLFVANCALLQTHAWKLLRRFPASSVDLILSPTSLCES